MIDFGFTPEFLRRLEQMSLLLRKVRSGRSQGIRRSPKKGSSVEFADFRNYSRGDDPRRVDWNAYARLGRLFVKLFIEEQDTALHVLVDNSRSMCFGEPSKFWFACRTQAALSYIALENFDRASAGYFAERLSALYGPVSGKSSWKSVWEFIGQHIGQTSTAKTQINVAMRDFCARKPAPGATVVITDMLTHDYEPALKSLQALSQDVTLIHVMSPDEVRPELFGELRLHDSETGAWREVSLTPAVIRAYAQKLTEHTNNISRFCMSRGIGYIRAQSDLPVEDLISSGLRTLGLLR